MSPINPRSARIVIALILATLVTVPILAADWPGFRGPADGAAGALPETFGLTVAWTRAIGPGYSSLAVDDGKVIAAFTDGDHDVLAAFDATSGDEVWRLRLGEKYAGHDGSTDGPLATPAIADGRVFMLGAHGQVVAAAQADGTEIWRVQLDDANSTEPFYGYTSSPLVVGDLVLLMTGGEAGAITAFDSATGEVRWRRGEDSVEYQSAALVELAGRPQVIAPSNQWVHGLDPRTGEVLWSLRHSDGETREGSMHATAAGDDRLLLNLQNDSLVLRVTTTDGGVAVEELWRGRPLSGSFGLPVYHDGHLYGFTGRIFSSVDAATGELNWRTRELSSFNLSLVDGRLVALARDGSLVVVEATPTAYTEVARVAALDNGDYADPAYADGRVFVRNLEQLAAITIDPDATPRVAEIAEDEPRHLGEFGAWVAEVEALPVAERQAAVDAYFADVESTPITEGRFAHIVHKGATQDVGVSGTVFGWTGEEVSLHRVAGTDLFYRTLELDPKGAYDYQLTIDFAGAAPDPNNPRVEDRGFQRQSILHMPEWSASPAVDEPAEDVPRGQLDRFQFRSQTLGNAREIQVWTPPGYEPNGETSYPLLVVHHGDQSLLGGLFTNVLDHVASDDAVATPIAVFVSRASGPEYNGELADAYVGFVADELVPHLRAHYRVAEGPAAAFGVGSGAVIALRSALARPEHFDRVAALSFYVTDADRDEYWRTIAESDAELSLVRVETGPNDYDIAGAGIDSERSSRTLVEKLRAAGQPVDLVIHHGAAGWASWRDRVAPALVALLPGEA